MRRRRRKKNSIKNEEKNCVEHDFNSFFAYYALRQLTFFGNKLKDDIDDGEREREEKCNS